MLLMTRFDGQGVGLGDHIQSLPVVCELVKNGWDLSVYVGDFVKSLYKNVGCKTYGHRSVLPGIKSENINNFGSIYSLIEWGIAEDLRTKGNSTIDRTSLFASLFDIERPASFDFKKALNFTEDRKLEYVIFAPQSSDSMRTLPNGDEIYKELQKKFDIVYYFGLGRTLLYSFDAMVDFIGNASAVITTDNGIMNIAMALSVPTYALFGVTDETIVCEPYEFYNPTAKRLYDVRKPKDNFCQSPCSRIAERGRGLNGRCLTSAECLSEINAEQLAKQVKQFYNLRSN